MNYVLSTRVAAIAAALIAVLACAWLIAAGTPVPAALIICFCGGGALAGFLVLGSADVLDRTAVWLTDRPWRVAAPAAGIWVLYLVYSAGMGMASMEAASVMALYFALPFLLLSASRGSIRGSWQDAAAILCLWLPLELGYVRRLLITSRPTADFHYALAQGLALNAGVIAFAAWRRLPGIGFRFELNRRIVVAGLKYFGVFAAIAIPLGLGIHFIRYAFTFGKLAAGPAAFIGIFLFTAIPEEFLFRGLIQNWFERIISRRGVSLALAALVFGASHLNNGPPIPNYKYFFMASIAGVFYGLAWRRTGSLMASAFTHALVDTLWSVIFR